MRKWMVSILCFLPVSVLSSEIRSITVQTAHMSPRTLQAHLPFQTGDTFDLAAFEKAKADLQHLHFFKTLEFLYREDKNGVDIRIRADDHTYLVVSGLVVSGKKHAAGVSLSGRNFLKQAENITLFIGGGKDGFNTHGEMALGNHTFRLDYFHLRFEQSFYSGGWVSENGLFSPADDKGKYRDVFLDSVKGTQDDFSVSYEYRFSPHWHAFVTPEYEYYRYDRKRLDTGNHSHVSAGLQYTDDVHPTMNMADLSELSHVEKQDILTDLPRVRSGKTAQVAYMAGGAWSGSDFTIKKWTAQGKYGWEFPSRQQIALFTKVQYAPDVPFSNGVESSELLFGMGIYDREQRGKQGFSAGISWTYFPLRNQTGILSLVPFYEQAYVSDGGRSYASHSGVGLSAGYRFWHFPIPISVTLTHNLTDGSQHAGVKVGGRF